MTTVHMIGNAHIDPVWLWRWADGVVESLATCTSAVRLLDRYPDFVFTRADAWVHEQIKRYDPPLFDRVSQLIDEGRWAPVGGWYIQPDCNFPSADSFRRQMWIGNRFFSDQFGIDIHVGFNVDSFGHAATLPSLLRESGYDSYVMMRPAEHEMELPASLFRWRAPDGSEVVTWRIPGSYNAHTPDALERNIRAALEAADEKIGHVMCFYGVGDHGGGPTAALIEWIAKNRDAYSNARLEFSSPAKFFEAVQKAGIESLPVVQTELQKHAIGCYSVVAQIKRDVRRAETALNRAETLDRYLDTGGVGENRGKTPDGAQPAVHSRTKKLEEAWKLLLFNQFHDTIGGSSIAEAYTDARDQLGSAIHTADEITNQICVHDLVQLEEDPLQRFVLYNPTSIQFAGVVYHEPWIHGQEPSGRLLDSDGNEKNYQVVRQSAMAGEKRGMIWIDAMDPESRKILRYDPSQSPGPVESDIEAVFEASSGSSLPAAAITNDHWHIKPGNATSLAILRYTDSDDTIHEIVPGIVVQDDTSDTWSHGINGYTEKTVGGFSVTGYEVEESGPIRGALRVDCELETSRASLWFRLYRGKSEVEIMLRLTWCERFRIAKLVFPFPERFTERIDGIPGGWINRRQDGTEYPVRDWFIADSFGVCCPQTYALDGSDNRVRCTLLRSPVYAWHRPTLLSETGSYHHTDQGTHTFRFFISPNAEPKKMDQFATMMHAPPLCFDWTRGMA